MQRALILEDQDLMRLALMAELQECFSDCYISGAQTFEVARQILSEEEFDLVVVDPGLPGFDPTSEDDRLNVVGKIIQASPGALHIVVTGQDVASEAEACRLLGARAYLGKTGLSRGVLGDVLAEGARGQFSRRFSEARTQLPDVSFSGLTQREEQIVAMVMQRPRGTKRCAIFQLMGERFDIDAASAQKYYKQARAKLIKVGQLPKGL